MASLEKRAQEEEADPLVGRQSGLEILEEHVKKPLRTAGKYWGEKIMDIVTTPGQWLGSHGYVSPDLPPESVLTSSRWPSFEAHYMGKAKKAKGISEQRDQYANPLPEDYFDDPAKKGIDTARTVARIRRLMAPAK